MYISKNVYKLKLLDLGLSWYRHVQVFNDLSLHKSPKFYLYELMWKIRMPLALDASKDILT